MTRRRTTVWLFRDIQCCGFVPFLLTLAMTLTRTSITMTHAFSSPRYYYYDHHNNNNNDNNNCHCYSSFQTAVTATRTFVNLHYTEFSIPTPFSIELTEPPVLFLHGLLGSKRNFASLGTSLASQLDNKRRIFAMDLRNHGTTHSTGTHHT